MPEERGPNIHVIMIKDVELPGGTALSQGQKLELEWALSGGNTLDSKAFVDETTFIRDPEHMKKVRELGYGDEVDDMPLTVVSTAPMGTGAELVWMTDDSGLCIPCVVGLSQRLSRDETYLIEGDVRSLNSKALCINVTLVKETDGVLRPLRRL